MSFLFSDNTPSRDYFLAFLKENKGIGYIMTGVNKKLSLVAKKSLRIPTVGKVLLKC